MCIRDRFNIQLIDYGSYIISARLHCLSKLYPIFKNIYQDITSGKEKIFFKYFSSIPLQDTFEFLSIKNYFAKAIEEKKKEEYFQKKSLVGPHRDDVVFYVNDLEAKRYCSRGQQRSIVLALKIAIMNVFKEESGEYPLLLLDDLMLELDQSRQQSVAKLLNLPEQSFITTTVLPAEFLLPYTAIKMHDGQLFVVRGD